MALLLLLLLPGLLATACASRRAKKIAQDDDKELTEAQVRGRRLHALADTAFDAGDLEEAQARCVETLQADPTLHRAHIQLADIYERWGDQDAALAELVAHMESVPRSSKQLERMLPYLFGKFSRKVSDPTDIQRSQRARAMADLSLAIELARAGKTDDALKQLVEVREGFPLGGVADYYEGAIHLAASRDAEALGAFAEAARANPYYARVMLDRHMDRRLPELLPRLEQVLARSVAEHQTDAESAFLLACIYLRQGQPNKTIAVLKNALAWGEPHWDMLVVQAAAHEALGQTTEVEKALGSLRAIEKEISTAFHTYTTSLFHGLLADQQTKFVLAKVLPAFDEPQRSYLRWRLLAELDPSHAEPHRQAFLDVLRKEFGADWFKDPVPADKTQATEAKQVSAEPKSLHEFMGRVQSLTTDAIPDLMRCDDKRRSKRSQPTGTIVLQVEVARDGSVGQVGILENSTRDSWLAYCLVAKVSAWQFPEPLRVTELFKMPVTLGMASDAQPSGVTEAMAPGPETSPAEDPKDPNQ